MYVVWYEIKKNPDCFFFLYGIWYVYSGYTVSIFRYFFSCLKKREEVMTDLQIIIQLLIFFFNVCLWILFISLLKNISKMKDFIFNEPVCSKHKLLDLVS